MVQPQRAGWCVHYCPPPARGAHVCKAGVDVRVFSATPFEQRPCFLTPRGESKVGAVVCDKLLRPTAEEIAADRAEMSANVQRLELAWLVIHPWREKHKDKRGHSEVLDCPICHGRLHLSFAGTRRHVSARCETPDCIAFIQ